MLLQELEDGHNLLDVEAPAHYLQANRHAVESHPVIFSLCQLFFLLFSSLLRP